MLALVLSAVASFVASAPAASDCSLSGTWSSKTGQPLEVTELSRRQAGKVLDAVETQFGPDVADDIRDAIDQGLTIGFTGPYEGIYGMHDWNTIGLTPYSASTPEILAIILVHEFEHVENCGGGPGVHGGAAQDPTTGVNPDPCGPVNHMDITAQSLTCACEELASASTELQAKLCKMINEGVDTLASQAGAASAAGCPTAAIPDPYSLVPIECLDFCNS